MAVILFLIAPAVASLFRLQSTTRREGADRVRMPIVSSDKFTEWFNQIVPGAYRKITTQDVRDMAGCKLIAKYQYFGRADSEVVRAILLYE